MSLKWCEKSSALWQDRPAMYALNSAFFLLCIAESTNSSALFWLLRLNAVLLGLAAQTRNRLDGDGRLRGRRGVLIAFGFRVKS
jgi:hypothetical protein